MKLIRIPILATLVAICMFSAVAEASAAAPTFNVEEGNSLPQTIKITSPKPVIESAKGTVITCESVTGEGKIVESGEGKEFSNTVSKLVLIYHKCTHNILGGGTCSNNSEKNAVVSEPLKGTIGYLGSGKSDSVGLALEGEAEHGAEEPVYASFSCMMVGYSEPVKIRGHLVGEIGTKTTYGTYQESDALVYKQSKGVQEALEFSGVTNQLYITDPVETNSKLGIGSEPTLEFNGHKTRIQAGTVTFFEEEPKLPQSFTTSYNVTPMIETPAGLTIACKSVSGTGEIVESGEGNRYSNTVAKVLIAYHNCTASLFGGQECSNNSEKNAIVTEPLRGELGYVESGVNERVGLMLEGEAEHGSERPLYAKFTCSGGSSMQITGRLVGLVGVTNVLERSNRLYYEASSGVQEELKFPGVTNQLRIAYAGREEDLGIEEQPTITYGGNDIEVEAR